MKYSFTGVTNITPVHEAYIHHVLLNECADGTHFYTGAAEGVDSIAALHAKRLYPDARHIVVVPGSAPSNAETLVAAMASEGYDFDLIINVEDERPVPETYMARNDVLVHNSECLIAMPMTYTEQIRSGTWATYRRAKKRGIEIRLRPLSLARGLLGV